MKKRVIVVIVFMLMTLPVYAHIYDDPNGFGDWELGSLRPQEGAGEWWGGGPMDEGVYPYCDAVVELDPDAPDPNDNHVLNIVGPISDQP